MTNQERIVKMEQLLTEALSPAHLDVIDNSAAHAGHAGAATGMGHFTLNIQADALQGLPMVQAHRKIYKALGDMMETDIHALTINLKA